MGNDSWGAEHERSMIGGSAPACHAGGVAPMHATPPIDTPPVAAAGGATGMSAQDDDAGRDRAPDLGEPEPVRAGRELDPRGGRHRVVARLALAEVAHRNAAALHIEDLECGAAA